MALSTLTADGGLDIQQLQQIVQDKELTLGWLCNIGLLDTGTNVLTFNIKSGPDDVPPPGRRCVLESVAGHPSAKAGFTLVCYGSIFMQGKLASVATYRPS